MQRSALAFRRHSGPLAPPASTYESVANALAEEGQTRAAHEVLGWLLHDHGRQAHPKVIEWVFDGLLWAGHLHDAAGLLLGVHPQHLPARRSMTRRLVHKMRKDGFARDALKLARAVAQ